MTKLLLAAILLTVVPGRIEPAPKPFIDWKSLHNPILSYPNWSIKDVAMAYRDHVFYLFFSAFYEDGGRIRSHVVEVSTADFRMFSDPIFNFDSQDEGWIGMCSPDVQRMGNQYVLTFNSWGDKPGKLDALFYMTSSDLVHWSKRQSLAASLTANLRVIDAALANADGGYYLTFKEGTHQMKPRLGFAKSLDGPFEFIESGYLSLLMEDGKENGLIHENYEFIQIDGKWRLLTTDYNPPHAYLYTLRDNSKWLSWTRGYQLNIPTERFNTDNVDNAGALYDWRSHDGYFYFIYAGRDERVTYLKRGWNRLALARSKDLVHWTAAGEMQ